MTFQLAELSSLPSGSYSDITTYQTLVEVRRRVPADWECGREAESRQSRHASSR